LQNLDGILKPSIELEFTPGAIAGVMNADLQVLISSMLRPVPKDRLVIEEIVDRLDNMISPQLRTIRNVALRLQDVEGQKEGRGRPVPLALNIDHSTPYSKHFSVIKDKIKRLDK
jgi:hypothetical protein